MLDEGRILQYLRESFDLHGGRRNDDNERCVTKQVRERRKFRVKANLSLSRYELVRNAIQEAGFIIKDKDDLSDALLIWTDNFLPFEKIMTLKPYQRINHFPGMIEICRKDFLAKNYMRMSRLQPDEYNFVPKTWVLPQEHGFFLNHVRHAVGLDAKSAFIMKPANGAMGHGIRLYRNGENVPANPPNGTPCVIQEYIANPLLIDGYKCDLRVYVLITSCDPLRVFIYDEGLVRLSTEKYVDPGDPNGDSMYIHLTNYAVNKRHAGYVTSASEMDGSKRSFTFLDQFLRETKHVDPHVVWRAIRDLIVKTMALVVPHLVHSYRMCRRGQTRLLRVHRSVECLSQSASVSTASSGVGREAGGDCSKRLAQCHLESRRVANVPMLQSSFFEILGFDILIDSDLKPWLLEVNRSPSFNGDQELDRRVKQGLLKDALHLLNIRHVDKTNAEREQKLFSARRLYRSNSPLSGSSRARTTSSDVASGSLYRRVRQPAPQRVQLEPGLQKQIEKLHLQLLFLRRRQALEFFEYHNSGKWCLIFPTDDRPSQKRFASMILTNFAQFHNGKGGGMQKELEETYLRPLTEEDIMNRLDRLLRKHAEASLTYKKLFSQDTDAFQVDDYDVSSGEETSSHPGSPDKEFSSNTCSIGTHRIGVRRAGSPSRDSDSVTPHSQLRHLLRRNIRVCRKESGKKVRPRVTQPSVSRRRDAFSAPWRI